MLECGTPRFGALYELFTSHCCRLPDCGQPAFDSKTHTLSLSYPLTQYPVVMDFLRNDTLYCQFLTYANGHIWADLHTGSVRAR